MVLTAFFISDYTSCHYFYINFDIIVPFGSFVSFVYVVNDLMQKFKQTHDFLSEILIHVSIRVSKNF